MTEYWFNTKTGEVEAGKQSIAPYLIGPFHTAAEAEKAWEAVRERSAAWEAEEAAEDNWDEEIIDDIDPWDDDAPSKAGQ